MRNGINTSVFKEAMEEVQQAVQKQKTIINNSKIDDKDESLRKEISFLNEKSKETTFKLLLMGRFSSGKSSLVNVLLGEKILPEFALPTTALITEIYYGEKKKVVMFPKRGKWKGGNAPFEIEANINEIEKYCTIDNSIGTNKKEGGRVDSCFEKMVVYWPLDLLKDGVSIIDSPGTDDPYSNDYIVEQYVPKADAILYCINAMQAYCGKDKVTLEHMNASGFKSPIIVTTYFDVVTNGQTKQNVDKFINTTRREYYCRHTVLGEKGCHYVNSLQGLEGKLKGSQAALVESGYFELEKFLGQYLTENKGREKISAITSLMKRFDRNATHRIKMFIDTADLPLQEFETRVDTAHQKLVQAQTQGDLLMREFNIELKGVKSEIYDLAPKLVNELINQMNLDDFNPGEYFTLWHPKKSSEAIAEECCKQIELQNKAFVSKWNEKILQPKLTLSLKNIVEKMQTQFDRYDKDLNGAKISLEQSADLKIPVGPETGTRVAMFFLALLTGDWLSALIGATLGWGAFGRTLLCEFMAGLVLGMVALFTPVGLPALIIAALAGMVGGLTWTASKAANAIKKKTVEKAVEQANSTKDDIVRNVQKQFDNIFEKISSSLKTAINDDITEVKHDMQTIIAARKDNQKEIEQKKAEWNDLLKQFNDIDAQMDEIRQNYGIA